MKITVTKKDKDSYITIETEEKITTYKAKLLERNTGIYHGLVEYKSEVFEATFLKEEEVNE